MLFESKHLRVTAEYGTATLWLGFPGELANALDVARIRELDRAIRAVAALPSVQILVIRSANTAGFCAGIHPNALASLSSPADRSAFAWFGQQVFNRLAQLEAVSIAIIDGPCLGAGLELALACDYRLCVARPTTRLGFPDRIACFGGSSRLTNLLGRRGEAFLSSGRMLSGREAWNLKLVDLAYCERRSKIELRSFLDRLELHPFKPHPPSDSVGLASERRVFAAFSPSPASASTISLSLNPIPRFPETVGLLGDDAEAALLASEVALRGGTVVVSGNRSVVYAGIDAARARGFITPLEADQARRRIRSSETLADFRHAGLVFVAQGHDPFRLATTVLPRVLVCVIRPSEEVRSNAKSNPVGYDRIASDRDNFEVFPYPRRVIPVRFRGQNQIALFPSPVIDSDTTTTLAVWLRSFGRDPVFPPSRLCPSHDNNPTDTEAGLMRFPPDGSVSKSLSFVSQA